MTATRLKSLSSSADFLREMTGKMLVESAGRRVWSKRLAGWSSGVGCKVKASRRALWGGLPSKTHSTDCWLAIC